MPSNASSRPYLPRHLIEALKSDPVAEFKTSLIHSPDIERYRLWVISQRLHPHVAFGFSIDDELLVSLHRNDDILPSLGKWDEDDHKSHLHLAAISLDIPLVYETLRMGASPSYKDADGVTPLYLALEWIRAALLHGVVICISRPKNSSDKICFHSVRSRISRVAALLVEQHADVDSGYRDRTPLSVAVELGLWDVVELLLRHQVRVPPLKQLSFQSNSDKLQYLSLLTSVGEVTSRPPRPCPCWSGRPLSECHSAGWVPYPGDLLCRCGKNKKYANCCLKRKFKFMERWSEEHQMFQVTEDIDQVFQPEVPDWVTGLPGYSEGVDILQKGIKDFLSRGGDGIRDLWQKNNMQQQKAEFFDEFLTAHPDYEPAYSYANGKCDFFPRPWQDQLSKVEGRSRMDEWNALVDEYIASDKDKRSRFDIEKVSKIGHHGGPLYRQCEADECGLYEVRDVEVLRQCSGCKITVYCSHACQKAHWKTHKKECGTRTQRAQQLPIQRALEMFLMVMPALAGVWGDSTSSEDLLMSVIERDIAGVCGLAPPENMVSSPFNDILGSIIPGSRSSIRNPLTS